MIRKVYIDFVKERIAKKQLGWVFKRLWQYLLIHLSFIAKRPLCGPILGTLVTNYACNYRCAMCDIAQQDRRCRDKELKEFTTQQMKELIRSFGRLGTPGIGFTGGEPMLRKDIFELLAYTKELGIISHLNTNGFFLNEENTRRIIEAGVDSINISLDGATLATHDAIRGFPGAFQKAIQAVNNVITVRTHLQRPVRIKLVMVVSEKNIDEIPAFVDLAASLGVDCIEFIPLQPFRENGNDADSPFDEAFFKKLRATISFLREHAIKKIRIENSPRDLELFEKSFRGEPSPVTCYAGYNSLAVDCYGEIYPCVTWINWGKSIGNISEMPLEKFWYSEKYNRARRAVERCRDCYINCQTELNLLFKLI